MTFQERVTARLQDLFPKAQFITIVDGNTANGFEWVHRAISHEPPFGSAEDMVMESISELRFFKEPDFLFIRLVDSGNKLDANSGMIINSAVARFGMGYKI